MKAIQLNNNLNKIFSDKKRDITEDRLKSICKIGQGEKTCRYIMRNSEGYSCVKNSVIQISIDELISKNAMTAKGNNCSGLVNNEESENNEQKVKKEKNLEEESCEKENNQEEDNKKENN